MWSERYARATAASRRPKARRDFVGLLLYSFHSLIGVISPFGVFAKLGLSAGTCGILHRHHTLWDRKTSPHALLSFGRFSWRQWRKAPLPAPGLTCRQNLRTSRRQAASSCGVAAVNKPRCIPPCAKDGTAAVNKNTVARTVTLSILCLPIEFPGLKSAAERVNRTSGRLACSKTVNHRVTDYLIADAPLAAAADG